MQGHASCDAFWWSTTKRTFVTCCRSCCGGRATRPWAPPRWTSALGELETQPFDVILVDLRMPGRSGLDLVDEVRRRKLETTVVVMTAYGSKEVAIEAMKRGAYDYLSKPFESDELVLLLRKAEERERLFRENQNLRRQLRAGGQRAGDGPGRHGGQERPHDRAVPHHPQDRRVQDHGAGGRRIGHRQGAGGAGAPPAVARARTRPFIAVNCGAIPAHAAGVRAVRPPQGRLHRRQPRPQGPVRGGHTAGRCSSTRSASCRWRCR